MFTPKASLKEFILIKGVFPEAMGQFTCQPVQVQVGLPIKPVTP